MRRIVTTGFILELVCAATLSAGCAEDAVTKDAFSQSRPAPAKSITQAVTYVYECDDDYNFVARIEGDKAWLFLPAGTVSLPQTPSGLDERRDFRD